MFINSDALGVFFAIILTATFLLLVLMVAHLAWLFRLHQSPYLFGRSAFERWLLLIVAACLPLVSFYTVKAIGWWKRRDLFGLKSLLIVTIAMLVLVGASGVRTQLLRLPQDSDWSGAASSLESGFVILMIPQLVLFMFVDVFGFGRRSFFAALAILPIMILLLVLIA